MFQISLIRIYSNNFYLVGLRNPYFLQKGVVVDDDDDDDNNNILI